MKKIIHRLFYCRPWQSRQPSLALSSIIVFLSAACIGHATLYVKDPIPTNAASGCYTFANLSGQNPTNKTLIIGETNSWGSTGTSTLKVDSNSLVYPVSIKLADSGGSLVMSNSSSSATDGRMLSRSITAIPSSGDLYISMLVRAENGSLANLTNSYSLGMGLGVSNIDATIEAFLPTNGVYFGFYKTGGTLYLVLNVRGTNYTLVTAPSYDTTYFCVAKIEIDGGSGGNEIIRAVANPASAPTKPSSFTVAVETNLFYTGSPFACVSIGGTYRTSNKRVFFDEIRLADTLAEVAPYGDEPSFDGIPTLTTDGAGSFIFSATLTNGITDTSLYACYGTAQGTASTGAWAHAKLVSSTLTSGVPSTAVLDSLTTNTSYYFSALATNATYDILLSGGTLLAGEVWATLGTNAYEENLLPGTAVFHRPSSATQTLLVVNYTVSGDATAGQHYVDGVLTGSVTMAAGQDATNLAITPLIVSSDTSDRTVILTITSGNYYIGAANAATVTIVNCNYNIWTSPVSTNASVAANWSLGHVPLVTEAIFLNQSDATSMVWDAGVNGLPTGVSSWMQTTNYTNTVTFKTTYPAADTTFTNFTVAGSVFVNGGTWTHPSNSASQVYRLQVSVGGNFTLGSSASLDVKAKGYGATKYPAGSAVGIHGGARDNFSRVYGNVYRPSDLGSGSSDYAGGGAIWLEVVGAATINGAITARAGDTGTEKNIGGGGSVYIKAASASGSGTVSASGNGYYAKSSGSGGRIAVELTNATTLAMNTNNFTARGGCGDTSTGAGTILIKTAGQTYGTLIVDNNRYRSYGCQPPTKYGTTCITAGETWSFDSILIRDYGVLSVPSGTTLNLPNGWASVSRTNGTPTGGILYMGGTIQLGVGTPYTFMSNWIFQADSPYTITGNVSVTKGAALGCISFRNSLASHARMDLTVAGNLDVVSDGYIYAVNAGVDYPNDPIIWGYHGGQRGAETTNVTYGSVLYPVLPGGMAKSGDRATIRPGGGVIMLTVSSNLNVDGSISAASIRSSYSGAAGGSVNITAGTLTGSGTINAAGGSARHDAYEQYYAGGGGRVAVRLTGAGATFGSFWTNRISALGYSLTSDTADTNALYSSSAGSVYLQKTADGAGGGTVIFRNDNSTANTMAFTSFPSPTSGGETDVFSNVSFVAGGRVIVKLTKSFSMQSAAIETGSKLDLNGYELKLMQLSIDGAEIEAGTYTATSLGSACVIDSSDPDTGTIIIEALGTVFLFE